MKRTLIAGMSVLVLWLATSLSQPHPLPAAPAAFAGCCYNDCMNHCTEEHSFLFCHNLCNSECESCGGVGPDPD